MLYEVFNTKTKQVVYSNLPKEKAFFFQNTLNDQYAIQCIKSDKAPNEFKGVFKMRKSA